MQGPPPLDPIQTLPSTSIQLALFLFHAVSPRCTTCRSEGGAAIATRTAMLSRFCVKTRRVPER